MEGDLRRCARHPAASSTFTCPRCGAFGCIDCERRTSFNSAPMCPACWAIHATSPGYQNDTLQTVSLVVGVIALFPCCPLTLGSLALSAVAFFKSAPQHRWKPVVGALCALVGGLIQSFFVLYSIFSAPAGR